MSTSKVIITAESAQAVREFEQFRAQATGSLKKVAEVGGQLNGLFATLGVTVSAASFVGMVKGAIDAADNLNDLSKKTGIAINDLAGLKLAAKLGGGDLDSLADSISKLTLNMGKDSERFARLGVTAKEPLEAFKQFADVFAAIEDPQMRAALGAEALGKSWQGAAPLLDDGGAAIGALVERGKELNPVTEEMAAQAGLLNDRLDELGSALDGLKAKLAVDMTPGLVNATTAIKQAYEEGGKLSAVWTALGAAGSFLFTDEFDSPKLKIKDLREELVDLEEYLSLSKNAPLVGYIERRLMGGTTEELEVKIAAVRAQIAALQAEMEPKPAAFEDPFGDRFMAAVEAYGGARARVEAFLARKTEAEADRAKREYQSRIKGAKDFAESLARERVELGLNSEQIAMMAAAREAAKAPTAALREQIMSEAFALLTARQAWDAKAKAEALAAESAKSAKEEVDSINEQTRALQFKTRTYGLLPAAITAVQIAELEASRHTLEWMGQSTTAIDLKIAALERLKLAQAANQTVEGSDNVTQARELLDIMSEVDSVTQAAAAGMSASFGKVGSAIGGLTTALSGYGRAQAAVAAQLAASTKAAAGDPVKIAKLTADAARQSAQAQIRSYGDMAGAAKGFFKENSTGYKVMEAVEKSYRAAEMAMAIESMLTQTGLLTNFTSLFATSKGTQTATALTGDAAIAASAVSGATVQVGAIGAVGTAAATAGVATQALGDPYTAWARMAAMAAVMAGLGYAVSGGRGSSSGGMKAADVQKLQGTGSVFGDAEAKSNSISASIEMLEQHSSELIPINQGMLAALRNIEASMLGVANLVVRTPGVMDGSNFNIKEGTISSTRSKAGGLTALGAAGGAAYGATAGAILGPLGMAIGAIGGAILGFVASLWGKTKQTVVDSGIQFDGSLRSLQSGAGYKQYASVDTTKSSWFGMKKSTSNAVETQGLDAALSQQFALIFTNVEKALAAAATNIGIGADQVAAALDGLTIDEKLSLKGLSGEALTNAINSVVSKTMDQMAQAALPAFDQFRQVGEGYAETVIRVAGNYSRLDTILRMSGMTFGATGMASLAARERLIALAGGIDELAKNSDAFAQEFLTEAERMAPIEAMVSEQMAKLGLSSIDTREEFKQVVQSLDLTTEAGANQYTALMALAGAFAQVHPALAATTVAARDAADILAERKSLQDQLDQLTMTATQLRQKERNALDESNRAIFDRINAINDERAAIEAAQTFAAGLMGDVDSAFSTLQSVIGRQKNAVTEAHTAAMKLLDKQVTVQTDIVNKHKALAGLLTGTLDNMKLRGGEAADRASAQAQIRTALAIAKAGGVLPDADTLRKSLGVVSQDASSMFATYADYARDFYTTQNDIAALGKLTDDALSVDQQSLQALLDQKELAQQAYEAEMKRLDTIVSNAAEQVAVLKGQSTTLLSIEQALQAFLGSIGAALANPMAAGAGAITGTYQSALGRTPDAAGMKFWQDRLAEGVSQSEIDKAIRNSPEAKAQALYQSVLGRAGDAAGIQFWTKQLSAGVSEAAVRTAMMGSAEKRMKLPGFAAGGDFGGGLRIVGERGPELEATGPSRIWNAAQTRTMLGGDNSAVVAELRSLHRTIEQQASELADIKRQARRQADMIEQLSEGGNALRTKTETTPA